MRRTASRPDVFVPALAVELSDGLVGLLLNGLVRGRCPHGRDIATAIVDSHDPARARHAKDLSVFGAPFGDDLERCFAAPYTTVDLPA